MLSLNQTVWLGMENVYRGKLVQITKYVCAKFANIFSAKTSLPQTGPLPSGRWVSMALMMGQNHRNSYVPSYLADLSNN